jgi:SMC interacting uncharacterized protein involved in chromosome segregation
MKRVRLIALPAAVIACVGLAALVTGQEKKDEPPRARYFLPTYWRMLGLSDQQRDMIHKVQDTYRPQIADLERKIDELKATEKKEMEKILTEAQKARLIEILKEKGPTLDPKPKTEPEPKPATPK